MVRRVAFTLAALLVYQLGTYVPLPGINLDAWVSVFSRSSDPFARALYAAGVDVGRLSIFALGIVPYISAAVLVQLVIVVSSRLKAVSRNGAAGRRRIFRATLVLTVVLTVVQAIGFASALQSVDGLIRPDTDFPMLPLVASMIGGVLFLIWLSELITNRGVGNGIALILCTNIVVELPGGIFRTVEFIRQGILPAGLMTATAVLAVGLIALVVFVERARLSLPLLFAARRFGDRQFDEQQGWMSLKLNNAGLIPAVVAPWFIFVPLTLLSLIFSLPPWLSAIITQIQPGTAGHLIVSSVMIFVLTFVYTAHVVDPEQTAESLQKFKGVVTGIEPGGATADYVDGVVSRTTMIGAAYLTIVFLIPELLTAYAGVPFYLSGASALVVVCTVLDIDAQVRGKARAGLGG